VIKIFSVAVLLAPTRIFLMVILRNGESLDTFQHTLDYISGETCFKQILVDCFSSAALYGGALLFGVRE
jgi:hypothetical protein